MNEENIIKNTCKELGVTQKELAKIIGVNDGTIRKWSSQTEPPEWGVNFLKLLLDKQKISSKLEKFRTAFSLIDEARS